MNSIKSLKIKVKKEIKRAQSLKELNLIFKKYLGKKGELSLILRSLKTLSLKERKKIGKEVNALKDFLEKEIEKKAQKLYSTLSVEESERIDVTVPGKKPSLGHLHPLTQIKRKVMSIFQGMGFDVIEGPEIENEWYNFDALNIPKDHPARDLWDTLWINQKSKVKNQKLLLRTHTSPVQIRYMEKHNPPLRIIVPGKVFRHEATDPTHEFQFYQVEGLMVDKDVSVSHFKAIIGKFFENFFQRELKFRLRPDFFPFTEPSFDVAISCLICNGKGFILDEQGKSKTCPVCKKSGWLEVAGAGMVHPNVFSACGLNPTEWQGWAFGFGLERLAMIKFKIDDVRLFHCGDLRFLQQF